MYRRTLAVSGPQRLLIPLLGVLEITFDQTVDLMFAGAWFFRGVGFGGDQTFGQDRLGSGGGFGFVIRLSVTGRTVDRSWSNGTTRISIRPSGRVP